MAEKQEVPSSVASTSFVSKGGIMNTTRCISAKIRKSYDDEANKRDTDYYAEYVARANQQQQASPTKARKASASDMKEWDFSTSRARPNTSLVSPFNDFKQSDEVEYSWRASSRSKGQAPKKSIRNGIMPFEELDEKYRQKPINPAIEESVREDKEHGIIVDHSTIDDDDGVDEIFEALLASNDHSIHFTHQQFAKRGLASARHVAIPEMDMQTKNKYFGASSKVRYNATYRELANRREKLIDESEVRELIEVTGPVMSEMKKSLRKLDNFMEKDQEKHRLKLIAEMEIQQMTLAPLDTDAAETYVDPGGTSSTQWNALMSPAFKRVVEADDKDDVADPKHKLKQSGHEMLGLSKATGIHIPHIGMSAVHGHGGGANGEFSPAVTARRNMSNTIGSACSATATSLKSARNDGPGAPRGTPVGSGKKSKAVEQATPKIDRTPSRNGSATSSCSSTHSGSGSAHARPTTAPIMPSIPLHTSGSSSSLMGLSTGTDGIANLFQAAKVVMEQDVQYKNEFTTADSLDAENKKRNAFAETYEMNSPRAVFLSGCLEYDIPPRSNVLLRSKLSSVLDLSNQGLNDQLGLLLAESLSNHNMPAVTSVILSGNDQLTDVSMPSILAAVISNHSITSLDISNLHLFNAKVHCDSDYNMSLLQPLVTYLSKRYCPLRRLSLGNLYLEDRDCGKLVDALLQNRNFEELDLSHNRLGMNEEVSGAAKASTAKQAKAGAKANKSKSGHGHGHAVQGQGQGQSHDTHGSESNNHGHGHGHANVFSGGELIGSLLRTPVCPVTTLVLSYNMIHGLGAVDLCDSVKYSKSLLTLDLSYNDIGNEGAMSLGAALIGNTVLRHINVGHNRIGAEGTLVLCVGVRESHVTELNIDGNPIGEEGARMVMSLAISKGDSRYVAITSTSCDATPFLIAKGLDMRVVVDKEKAKGHDATGLAKQFLPKTLDLSNPVGFYSLSMSSVIGRAMLFEILFRISSSSNIEVTSFEYSPTAAPGAPAVSAPKRSSFISNTNADAGSHQGEKILRKTKKIPLSHLDSHELALMEKFKLHVAVAKKMSSAAAVRETLTKHDPAGLGYLTVNSFRECLDSLGLQLDSKELVTIMKSFDDSRSNTMEYEEFLGFVKMLGADAEHKMHDLTTNTYCVLASAPNKRYIPPTVGKVTLTVSMSYEKNEFSTCGITEAQVMRAIHASKSSMIAGTMLSHVVGMGNFRFAEAVLLLNAIALEIGQTAKTLGRLLPHVVSPTDAIQLINLYAGRDVKKYTLLEEIVGKHLLRVILGHYDGFYHLNMESLSDQLCMDRLLGVSQDMKLHRKKNDLGDTSQHGNGSCFRNEHIITGYGEKSVTIKNFVVSKEYFTPMPTDVRIEFDFSSGVRPDPTMSTACNDLSIVGLIDHLGLLQDPLDHAAIEKSAEAHAQETHAHVEKAIAAAEKEKASGNRSRTSSFAQKKPYNIHSNHNDIGMGQMNDQTIHQSKRSRWAIKELALLKAANVRSNNGAGRGYWQAEEGRAMASFRYRMDRFRAHIPERLEQHMQSLFFPKPFPFTGIYEEGGQKKGITASIRNVVNLAMSVTKVASKLLSKFKLKKNKFGLAKLAGPMAGSTPHQSPASTATAAAPFLEELVPVRSGKLTPSGGSRPNSRGNSLTNTPRTMVNTAVNAVGSIKRTPSSNALRAALDDIHNERLRASRRNSNASSRGGAGGVHEGDNNDGNTYVDIDADGSAWLDMKGLEGLDNAGSWDGAEEEEGGAAVAGAVITGVDRLHDHSSSGSSSHTPLVEGIVTEFADETTAELDNAEGLVAAVGTPDRFANLNRYKLLDASNKATEAKVIHNLKKRFPAPKPLKHGHHHHHLIDHSHDDPYVNSTDYIKCHPEHTNSHHIARKLGTFGALDIHPSHYIPRRKGETKVVCTNDSYVNICLHYFALAKCLKCRHMAVLLQLFDEGRKEETADFGTYRVDLLISLYSRIVDIHNMDCVFAVLTAAEQACFIQRIGILNVFNPWKCDGTWCLDLSEREDRVVLRALLHLNMAESHKLIYYFHWIAEPEKHPEVVLTNRAAVAVAAGDTNAPNPVSRAVSRKSVLTKNGELPTNGATDSNSLTAEEPCAVIRQLMADWMSAPNAMPRHGHLTISLDSGGGHRVAVHPNNLTIPSESHLHDPCMTIIDAPLRDSLLALSLVDYDWLEINFGMMAALHKIPTINSFIAGVVTRAEGGNNANAGNAKNHADVLFDERSPKDKNGQNTNNLKTLNTQLSRIIRAKYTLAEREERATFNTRGVKIIPPEEMDTALHHMRMPFHIGWTYTNTDQNDM